MAISIIAAVAKNNVIGNKGKLPWHLPKDMAYFMKTTKNHPVIMGRKTFESIGKKPLPERTNIIVTRQEAYPAPGCLVAHSLEEALFYASISSYAEDIFIIGGSSMYEEGLTFAEKLYITEIDHEFEGDTFFPKINFSQWKEISRLTVEPDEKNQYRHSYIIYERLSEEEYSKVKRTFFVSVEIMLKDVILDPQGKVIMKSLCTLGFADVENVRMGKLITLQIKAKDAKEARQKVDEMCKKLLINPIIEKYEIKV